MLTSKPTPEMIQEWKNIYEDNYNKLSPNRKTGEELKEYFCAKYQPEAICSSDFIDGVKDNIMLNEANKEKLPQGKLPQIVTYALNDNTIFVGIDLVTGFYHIEGEDMEAVADIYDDLFAFRGLDKKDLQNYFLVAQYMICKTKEKTMFRDLARKKKQITDAECIAILQNEPRGVLSVLGDDDYPYGMPMNHWYNEADGKIYFHCGKKGHRLDAIAKYDKVSYCVYDEGYREEGDWALHIKSVIVFGRIKVIDDMDLIIDISTKLSHKFTQDDEYIKEEIRKYAHETLLLQLTPEHICGKLVKEA